MKTNRVRKDSKAAGGRRQLKVPPQLPDLYRQEIAESRLFGENINRLLLERESGVERFFLERERTYYFWGGKWQYRSIVEPWRRKKRSVFTQKRISTREALRWIVGHVIPEEVQHHFRNITAVKGGAR